jgi:NADPH2:quinone reductase
MRSYRALRVHQGEGGVAARVEDLPLEDPAAGEVLIRVAWSGVNYKDALAVTGRGRVLRRYPLTAGIDAAGAVAAARDPRFREGDAVIVTGYGLSQDHDGGYAEYLRIPADWVLALPAGLTPRGAMAVGTAGFTAALALERLETNGQTPDLGPFVVTGASGGVGSFAVDLFSRRGYPVVAASRKSEVRGYLTGLGAAEVVDPQALVGPGEGPLATARWGGAVDSVGGRLLGELLRAVGPGGSVAAVGLAGGHGLATSVMPFILRGVSLLGVNSAGCPMALRERIWERLAADLLPRHLGAIATGTVALEGVPAAAEQVLAGRVVGRYLVRIGDDRPD